MHFRRTIPKQELKKLQLHFYEYYSIISASTYYAFIGGYHENSDL